MTVRQVLIKNSKDNNSKQLDIYHEEKCMPRSLTIIDGVYVTKFLMTYFKGYEDVAVLKILISVNSKVPVTNVSFCRLIAFQ